MVVPTIDNPVDFQQWTLGEMAIDDVVYAVLPEEGVALEPGKTLVFAWWADVRVAVYVFNAEQYRTFKIAFAAEQALANCTATGKFGYVKITVRESDTYYAVIINDSSEDKAILNSAELSTG
jgi:hypothetical protein